MSSFNIEFAVICETNFGQKVCICGNLPFLGSWNPQNGVLLQTNQKHYPRWVTSPPIPIRQGLQVEFKLCILNQEGGLVRWEALRGNRSFSPKGSLLIEFTDSDVRMIFKSLRKHSGEQLRVQNVRKGTEDVINDWGSDSSSNREMWREHEIEDEEQDSLLLTQFTNELTRSVASQREESFPSLQHQPEMQLHHQLDFGDYAHHNYHSHYILVNQLPSTLQESTFKYSNDQLVLITPETLPKLQLNHKQEISVFHLLEWDEQLQVSSYVDSINRQWKKASHGQMRGLTIVYFQSDPSINSIEKLLEASVNAFVVGTPESTNNVLTSFVNLNFKIYCTRPDVFTARNSKGVQVKLVFTLFRKKELLANFEEELQELKPKLMEEFYFGFVPKEFEVKLSEKLSLWKIHKSQCLIILQVRRLEQLQSKTIFDLVHLSSQRFKVIVFVITHERFPKNFQHRIPVAKHKVIFLNTLGDLYANTGQIIDLFYYLEINKSSFESNQNIILEQLGSGLKKSYTKNSSLVLDFPRNTLGEMLRKRTSRIVRDVNNKSIAKLVAQENGNTLEFVPFCLHLSFLYKVILTTFALRLKHYEKGMIISIDGTDLSSLRYLQPPEGPERNLKFLRFCLRANESRVSYACNPMSEFQLQRMIELISEQGEEENHKFQTPRKGQVLSEIKNIH